MTNLLSVAQDINFRFPEIVRSFGSAEDFVTLVQAFYLDKGDIYLHNLLSCPDSVVVLSQPFFRFSLIESSDISNSARSILRNSPYTLYNSSGEFLYSITEHNGVFGNSILDRSLIMAAEPLEQFYLQFDTYTGKRTFLLILNNFYQIRPTESNVFSTSEAGTPLVLNRTNKVSIAVNGSLLLPLTINFLKSAPSEISSSNAVLSSPLCSRTFFNELNLTYFIKESGWIVFSVNGLPLDAVSIQGTGTERFISVAQHLYYFCSEDLEINTVRNFFLLPSVANASPYSDIQFQITDI